MNEQRLNELAKLPMGSMEAMEAMEAEVIITVQCNPDLVTHLVCQKSVTKSRGVTK